MDRDYTAANPNYHMVMSVFGTSRCPLGGNRFISARGNAVPCRELLVIRRNQDFSRAVYGQLTGRGPQSVATLRSRSFRFTAAITRARPAIECALCNSTR